MNKSNINFTEKKSTSKNLIICLGGTGGRIFNNLMLLRDIYIGDDKDRLQIFHIDTDKSSTILRTFHCYYEDFNTFNKDIWNPYKEYRFPNNLSSKTVRNSKKGAGAIRIFGNASFVACRDKIKQLFEQSHELYKEKGGFDRVYIVLGGEGGTGSSMVIDLAAMLIDYHREISYYTPPIDIIMTGSDLNYEGKIKDSVRDRMQANHYALLKELNHFAFNPFISPYKKNEKVLQVNGNKDERLFEWIYYINSKELTITEASFIISEILINLCCLEVGDDISSYVLNESEVRDLLYPKDYIHPDYKFFKIND